MLERPRKRQVGTMKIRPTCHEHSLCL